jgi:hypothetical protein
MAKFFAICLIFRSLFFRDILLISLVFRESEPRCLSRTDDLLIPTEWSASTLFRWN